MSRSPPLTSDLLIRRTHPLLGCRPSVGRADSSAPVSSHLLRQRRPNPQVCSENPGKLPRARAWLTAIQQLSHCPWVIGTLALWHNYYHFTGQSGNKSVIPKRQLQPSDSLCFLIIYVLSHWPLWQCKINTLAVFLFTPSPSPLTSKTLLPTGMGGQA